MGFFGAKKQATQIVLLNVEDRGSSAMISYAETYADASVKTRRTNVRQLPSSALYTSSGIAAAECLGKVHIGWLKGDTRVLFLLTLQDRTVALVQEREGTARCNALLLQGAQQGREEAHVSCEVRSESSVEAIDIPIEVLPNLYDLHLSNVSLKHHKSYKNGKKELDYVTLKCRVNYCLNGRREGKRHIIFAGYDEKGGVVTIRGEFQRYHFTQAGYEFVETCFDDFANFPIVKICVSVKEI